MPADASRIPSGLISGGLRGATGGVAEYVFIIYEQRLSASTGPASLSAGRQPAEQGNRITYYVFIFFSRLPVHAR